MSAVQRALLSSKLLKKQRRCLCKQTKRMRRVTDDGFNHTKWMDLANRVDQSLSEKDAENACLLDVIGCDRISLWIHPLSRIKSSLHMYVPFFTDRNRDWTESNHKPWWLKEEKAPRCPLGTSTVFKHPLLLLHIYDQEGIWTGGYLQSPRLVIAFRPVPVSVCKKRDIHMEWRFDSWQWMDP